jgi:hypothetical protein
VGAIPLLSIFIFARLPANAGEEMSGHRLQVAEAEKDLAQSPHVSAAE